MSISYSVAEYTARLKRVRPALVLLLGALVFCIGVLWARPAHSDNQLRRLTDTGENGLNLNPAISGDGKHVAFESTEDLANSGGISSFRAFKSDLANSA